MDEGYGRGVGWGEKFKGAWFVKFLEVCRSRS